MAGGLKKTMIYLGLADGDEYDDQLRASEGETSRRAPVEARRVADAEVDVDTDPHLDVVPAPESRPSRPAPAPVPVSSGSTAAPEPTRLPARTESEDHGYRAPVTPIKRAAASSPEGDSVRTLSTVHPRAYNDAKAIGEAFRSGMPVIMNVTELGENEAKRLVDFAAGLVFGLHGSISRVTSKVFLLTPSDVEVVGSDEDGAKAPGDLYDGD